MNWRRIFYTLLVCLVAFSAGATVIAVKGWRLYDSTTGIRDQVRYLIENGETIGQAPASDALSSSYIGDIFGDDPELREELNKAVAKGMEDDPSLKMGEIAAMAVTYRRNGDDQIKDLVVNVFGDLPLGEREIGFHRDGFFKGQVDRNLWQTGQSALQFLGRDLALLSENEEAANKQNELIEAIFSGEIMPLADSISEAPLYYTIVFPDPKNLTKGPLRRHVKAIVMKGYLSPQSGWVEIVALAKDDQSANYVAGFMNDLRTALVFAMRTRFRGVMQDTAWGNYVPVWWAYEMANTLEETTLVKDRSTVVLRSEYQRVMVNASLKTIERFGRDLSRLRGVETEKLDPRLVDARMQSRSPSHYWSDAHRWGPNWPIGVSTNAGSDAESEIPSEDLPPVTQPL